MGFRAEGEHVDAGSFLTSCPSRRPRKQKLSPLMAARRLGPSDPLRCTCARHPSARPLWASVLLMTTGCELPLALPASPDFSFTQTPRLGSTRRLPCLPQSVPSLPHGIFFAWDGFPPQVLSGKILLTLDSAPPPPKLHGPASEPQASLCFDIYHVVLRTSGLWSTSYF